MAGGDPALLGGGIVRALRLALLFLRLGAAGELQYRANFLAQMVQSLVGLGLGLAGLGVVFSHTETLSGWRPAELLALLGVYHIMGAALGLVVQPSMRRLIEDVHQGSLDFVLTEPEEAQLLVSIRQVEVWKLADLALGLAVLSVALLQPATRGGREDALAFGLALLCGGAIVYSFWLILATCSFWLVRVGNVLGIFQSLYEAGRWPVGIYPAWLRWVLTFLVPVAFAVTVPAEALSGRLSGTTLTAAVVLAGVLLLVSRRFWIVGVRRYSGASA